MREKRSVSAPYNFVPFSYKVQLPYEPVEKGSAEMLPRHDRFEADRKTGVIHVTMTAETPVCISDGNQDHPGFFRGANGVLMIPGSSVRGMVRENMQILGFGQVEPGEDLDDYQIFFREVAAAGGSNAGDLKKYYQTVLDVETKRSASGRSYTIPQRVQSGYIRREEKGYQIYPTKTPYLRVSRTHPDVRRFQCGDSRADNAKAVPVLYRAEGGRVKEIYAPEDNTEKRDGLQSGVLLFTGKSVGKRQNHLYLFPEAAWDAAPVALSREDELSYREDLEKRRNSLGAYYDPKFWELPERQGEEKPVFYLRHEKHLYLGMSLFLRIGYLYPLSHGIPCQRKEQDKRVDYPHAILGFAKEENAYRSRVSFGDFPAEADAREMDPVPLILGEPKPSFYPGYVMPKGEETPVAQHYNADEFRLRGYKQYWLKEPAAASAPEDKKRVYTRLRPLPKGTKFQGVIRYQNLSKEELGLLLWALRLEEGCYQSIGMGKPYGYGRMKLTIDSLTEYDMKELYQGDLLPAIPKKTGHDLDNTVESYIRAYDNAASQALNLKKKHLRDRTEIQDFLFMKRTIQPAEGFSYMPLEDYRNTTEPLPTVQELRKRAKARREEEADKPLTMDDMLAALQRKYNAPSAGGGKRSAKRRT